MIRKNMTSKMEYKLWRRDTYGKKWLVRTYNYKGRALRAQELLARTGCRQTLWIEKVDINDK